MTNAEKRAVQDLRDERDAAVNDLAAARRENAELQRAVNVLTPVRQRYRSVRPVRAQIGERVLMHDDERIVNVESSGMGLIVWVESLRPEPETPEADRTPEGERAVTEEVAVGSASADLNLNYGRQVLDAG